MIFRIISFSNNDLYVSIIFKCPNCNFIFRKAHVAYKNHVNSSRVINVPVFCNCSQCNKTTFISQSEVLEGLKKYKK